MDSLYIKERSSGRKALDFRLVEVQPPHDGGDHFPWPMDAGMTEK